MPRAAQVIEIDTREIREKLRALPDTLAISIVKRGLAAAANLVATDARRRVINNRSVRTGALGQAIYGKTTGIVRGPNGRAAGHRAEVAIARIAFRPVNGVATAVKRPKTKGGKKVRYVKGDIYPLNYAHLVEFGTRPHHIGKGDDREVSLRRKGRNVIVGRGHRRGALHPGAVPKPYIRPAYDTKREEAVRVFTEFTARELDRELRRLAKKKGRAA